MFAPINTYCVRGRKSKLLSGWYPDVLDPSDKKTTIRYLTTGYLHSHTEGFLQAKQDQVSPKETIEDIKKTTLK